MTLKDLRQKTWWRIISNKYVIISVIFTIWILFLDSSAWLTSQLELDKQIQEKQQNINFYKTGIQRDQEKIKTLEDSAGIEKYARERYLMKKENEEVFIIEHTNSQKEAQDE
jgi:cell division protein FtsB